MSVELNLIFFWYVPIGGVFLHCGYYIGFSLYETEYADSAVGLKEY